MLRMALAHFCLSWLQRPTKPIELKVEVLWGHAYLAFIETREFRRTFFGMFPIEPQSSLVVLRDGRTTRFVEWPKRFEWEWFWPWDQTWQYLVSSLFSVHCSIDKYFNKPPQRAMSKYDYDRGHRGCNSKAARHYWPAVRLLTNSPSRTLIHWMQCMHCFRDLIDRALPCVLELLCLLFCVIS